MWLLFESGYHLRVAFIKLRMEDEIYCLKEGGVAGDTRSHCHACHFNGYRARGRIRPFTDVEEDEDKLEENEL